MEEHTKSHTESHQSSSHKSPKPSSSLPTWAVAAILIVGVVLVYFLFFSANGTTNTSVPTTDGLSSATPDAVTNNSSLPPDNTTLSKIKFLKELYTVNRNNYNFFEKAAAYRHESLDETKKFFLNCCDLTSEADIFAELPPIPSDFAEVAFSLATGRLYQLDSIGPAYYKQPEWYFHSDQTALVNQKFAFSGYIEPQLNYWGDYGGTAFPAEQFDTLSKSGRNTFSAVVFMTNGWNIQNWVGMDMVADSGALNNFDITISEESTGQPYFLLGPTFPTFSKDWATKLTITGKVKPGTPPGKYTIVVNPIGPPEQLNSKWSQEHLGLYVPYGGIAPETGYITLVVNVTE